MHNYIFTFLLTLLLLSNEFRVLKIILGNNNATNEEINKIIRQKI